MRASEGLAPDVHALSLDFFVKKLGCVTRGGHRRMALNTPLLSANETCVVERSSVDTSRLDIVREESV